MAYLLDASKKYCQYVHTATVDCTGTPSWNTPTSIKVFSPCTECPAGEEQDWTIENIGQGTCQAVKIECVGPCDPACCPDPPAQAAPTLAIPAGCCAAACPNNCGDPPATGYNQTPITFSGVLSSVYMQKFGLDYLIATADAGSCYIYTDLSMCVTIDITQALYDSITASIGQANFYAYLENPMWFGTNIEITAPGTYNITLSGGVQQYLNNYIIIDFYLSTSFNYIPNITTALYKDTMCIAGWFVSNVSGDCQLDDGFGSVDDYPLMSGADIVANPGAITLTYDAATGTVRPSDLVVHVNAYAECGFQSGVPLICSYVGCEIELCGQIYTSDPISLPIACPPTCTNPWVTFEAVNGGGTTFSGSFPDGSSYSWNPPSMSTGADYSYDMRVYYCEGLGIGTYANSDIINSNVLGTSATDATTVGTATVGTVVDCPATGVTVTLTGVSGSIATSEWSADVSTFVLGSATPKGAMLKSVTFSSGTTYTNVSTGGTTLVAPCTESGNTVTHVSVDYYIGVSPPAAYPCIDVTDYWAKDFDSGLPAPVCNMRHVVV